MILFIILHRMTSSPPRHVIWESDGLVAYLNPRPWTPGSVILESSASGSLGGSIFHLKKEEFLTWLLGARAVAELLCDRLAVRRCALVSRPHREAPAQVLLCPPFLFTINGKRLSARSVFMSHTVKFFWILLYVLADPNSPFTRFG